MNKLTILCSVLLNRHQHIIRGLLHLSQPKQTISLINFSPGYRLGYAVAQLVEALQYKSEGRRFDWNFSLT